MTVIADKVAGLNIFKRHCRAPSALSAGIGVAVHQAVLQEYMVGEVRAVHAAAFIECVPAPDVVDPSDPAGRKVRNRTAGGILHRFLCCRFLRCLLCRSFRFRLPLGFFRRCRVRLSLVRNRLLRFRILLSLPCGFFSRRLIGCRLLRCRLCRSKFFLGTLPGFFIRSRFRRRFRRDPLCFRFLRESGRFFCFRRDPLRFFRCPDSRRLFFFRTAYCSVEGQKSKFVSISSRI